MCRLAHTADPPRARHRTYEPPRLALLPYNRVTMEEYGTDPQHRENGLVGDLDDMDMMHDFGEGVGVDMRDFNVHPAEDSKDAIGQSASNRRPHSGDTCTDGSDPELGLPPDAGPSTGGSMPPSIAGANVDDMFQTETGLDEEEDDDDGEAPTTSLFSIAHAHRFCRHAHRKQEGSRRSAAWRFRICRQGRRARPQKDPHRVHCRQGETAHHLLQTQSWYHEKGQLGHGVSS